MATDGSKDPSALGFPHGAILISMGLSLNLTLGALLRGKLPFGRIGLLFWGGSTTSADFLGRVAIYNFHPS